MKFVNRAKMSVTSGGTSSSIILGVAPAGFQTFLSAGLQVNDEILYLIEDGLAWEIGKGRLGQSNAVSLLLRDEVIDNSQKTTNRLNVRSSGAFASVIPTAEYFNNVNSRLSSLDSAIEMTESLRDQAGLDASATAADRIQTGLDVLSSANNVSDALIAQQNAESARDGAIDAKTDSETARTGAETAQSITQEWANNDEDQEISVSVGNFSAKHWAAKAEASAAPVLSALGNINLILDDINGEEL